MKVRILPKAISVYLFLLLLLGYLPLKAQVTSDPLLPSSDRPVTIFFDATGTALQGYTGDVYAHTGVFIEGLTGWRNVIGNWGDNAVQPKLERVSANLYKLEIGPSIREFYNVAPGAVIQRMAFVFRAAAGSPQSQDLFLQVVPPGLAIALLAPEGFQPVYELNETVSLHAAANNATTITLYVNDQEVASTTGVSLEYEWTTTEYGRFDVLFVARDNTGAVEAGTYFYVRGQVPVAAMPTGLVNGPNYIDQSTVTLVLHDPPALKEYVFAIGDFNNWELSDQNMMFRTPDGTHYWITLTGLDPDTEYAYQYYIDGQLRLADPYTHKVLDPWNDQWISDFNYPELKPYPEGQTEGLVSILHRNWSDYQWQTSDFTPPAVEDLVIYELLIRDFVDTDAIRTVMDSLDYLKNLGVNAIELMPINQFEGNDSWGYNPALYFATDKAYGTWNDYKAFVDECHRRGIAVIIDMVLNHSFGLSPLVQMYFDPQAGEWGQPLPENPWYNEVCPHEPWCWGYDFDHESPYTQEFVDRVNEFWLRELRVDGFRFDFTKGFTNQQTANQGWNYDASRVAILKRMADQIWQVNPGAYVILEHFTENAEERELADYGMLIWGNMNRPFNRATMGWHVENQQNISDFSAASYQERGYANPHLIAYMESHDEERLMFENLTYGNTSNPNHNVRQLPIALRRNELATVFYFGIPGPKMIWMFGELGYDYPINHCPNGTVDPDCRTARKPIRWDYFNDHRRRNLYYIYSLMADLKTSHDVFRTDDYTLALAGELKRIHLNHASNNVTILGNFGVVSRQISPQFQQTGIWYEYFSGEQINITNVNGLLPLQPGEYRLYSTQPFPAHGLPLSTSPPMAGQNGQLKVYPNPSSSGFWFDLGNQQGSSLLEVFNTKGQLIFSKSAQSGDVLYWNGQLSQGNKAVEGLYFYRVTTGRNTFSGKLMVN